MATDSTENTETETETESNLSETTLSYKKLLNFFLPLAITPFFISTMHSFFNAAMARLPSPDLSIAMFTLVKGISHALKAPTNMFMQVFVSLVDDRQSFFVASKFAWLLSLAFFLILFSLGYTPLGGWFLRNIIGIQDARSIEFAYIALRITCFLPFVETLRNTNRGLVISNERTKVVSLATAVRLISVSVFLLWAVNSQALSGIVVGSFTWTVGIGIEGLVVFLGVLFYYSSPVKAAENISGFTDTELKIMDVVIFFLPLAVMMFLDSFINPLVQSGIARSPLLATQSLAAYGVAYGLRSIIDSPVRYLHHCSLVYVGEDNIKNWKKVRNFSVIAGLIGTAVMLILSLTPLGHLIMRHIIGVSDTIATIGNGALLAFSPIPLIRSIREAYWGLLMQQRNTRLIGMAKAVNIISVFIALIFLIGPFFGLFFESAAAIGALTYTIGHSMETLVIWIYANRNIKPASLTPTLWDKLKSAN